MELCFWQWGKPLYKSYRSIKKLREVYTVIKRGIPLVMAAEQNNWECCACHGNGTQTGRETLSKCSHTICGACFRRIIDTAPYYEKDYIKCPKCRVKTPVGATPGNMSEKYMYDWAEWVQGLRQDMKNIERMLTETSDAKQKEMLTSKLENMNVNFPQYMNSLKDLADDWGQWEKYEALTHIKEPQTA